MKILFILIIIVAIITIGLMKNVLGITLFGLGLIGIIYLIVRLVKNIMKKLD